jgi:hypothetical protein
MGVIGGKEKPPGTKKIYGFRQLRFLDLDGEVKVFFEVMARRKLILFEKNMGGIDSSRPPEPFSNLLKAPRLDSGSS